MGGRETFPIFFMLQEIYFPKHWGFADCYLWMCLRWPQKFHFVEYKKAKPGDWLIRLMGNKAPFRPWRAQRIIM